ncbi:hypothetical protein GAMM_10096 [Gammaproteobacteria bacterium]
MLEGLIKRNLPSLGKKGHNASQTKISRLLGKLGVVTVILCQVLSCQKPYVVRQPYHQ